MAKKAKKSKKGSKKIIRKCSITKLTVSTGLGVLLGNLFLEGLKGVAQAIRA
jgi:23S rRNA maturation mini-RNase III